MFHVNRYRMLEGLWEGNVSLEITNQLEIYDDLELIERFKFDRRTILQITQLL